MGTKFETRLDPPLRILLVDDDASLASLLAEMLEDMGHVVCGIETTEVGGIRAGLTSKPDLMIVDAHLGAGSGVTVVEAIARVAPVPHIFMSGAQLPSGKSAELLLLKPFMHRDLVNAIQRATGAG